MENTDALVGMIRGLAVLGNALGSPSSIDGPSDAGDVSQPGGNVNDVVANIALAVQRLVDLDSSVKILATEIAQLRESIAPGPTQSSTAAAASASCATSAPAPPPPVLPTSDRLTLKPKELAELLGISARKLWSMTNMGGVPSLRIGRCVLYPVAEVEEWLKRKAKRGSRWWNNRLGEPA